MYRHVRAVIVSGPVDEEKEVLEMMDGTACALQSADSFPTGPVDVSLLGVGPWTVSDQDGGQDRDSKGLVRGIVAGAISRP